MTRFDSSATTWSGHTVASMPACRRQLVLRGGTRIHGPAADFFKSRKSGLAIQLVSTSQDARATPHSTFQRARQTRLLPPGPPTRSTMSDVRTFIFIRALAVCTPRVC